MEILGRFGFETGLFFAQIINFLILAYLLKRFLYKPILSIMKARQEKITESLANAEKIKRELAETEKAQEAILKKTRIEADRLMQEAKKIAEGERFKILERSKLDANKIITGAKIQAESEMKKFEKQARDISFTLSQAMLDKILSDLFSERERDEIQKRALEQIKRLPI